MKLLQWSGLVFLLVLLITPSFGLEGLEEEHENEKEHKEAHELHSVKEILKELAHGDLHILKEIEHAFNPFNWISHEHKEEKESDEPYFPGINVDPHCRSKKKTYYRTFDGTCDWVNNTQWDLGKAGSAFGRDRPNTYADGINEPRKGPNSRELSNIFFKNKETKYWNHTSYLITFVEFLVHDLMRSDSGHDKGDVYFIDIPKCDEFFDPKCTGEKKLKFWRNAKMNGTGENGVPREIVNRETAWIDLSSIYGTTPEINAKLRTFQDGKLILDREGLLPLNGPDFDFPMLGFNKTDLFAVPDPRANQDLQLQAFATLFVREHNRLCDVLKDQYPEWDDERLFETARVVLSAKMNMIGGAYFLAYYTDMPGYATDMSVFQQWYGEGWKTINPFVKYPWEKVLNPATGAPDGTSNEFSIGYRWHDLLIHNLTLVDEKGDSTSVDMVKTAFSASKFKEIGFENILRGMSVTEIPDFHSGVQDNLRNVKYDFHDPSEGDGFDLAAWAIEHERERGLPTYVQFLRGYTGKVPIRIPEKFEDFSNNTHFVAELKRLYKSVEDVDLTVGQELDETWWPHVHVPRNMLVISFFTLFKGSISDRFAPNYNMFWCIIVGKPWNCKTNNALQDLLWQPAPTKLFPHARKPSKFWFDEINTFGQGKEVLHQMIVKNTNIKCLQKNVFFLPDPVTNPVVCYSLNDIPGPKPWLGNSNLDFISAGNGGITPYLKYAEKYGDIVHYQLKKNGKLIDFLLLSSAEGTNRVWNSVNFLARGSSPYIGYCYGRVVGYKNGTFAYGLSGIDGPLWWRHRAVVNEHVVPAFRAPRMHKIYNAYAASLLERIEAQAHNPLYDPSEDLRNYMLAVNLKHIFGEFMDTLEPEYTYKLYDAMWTFPDKFAEFYTKSYPWGALSYFQKKHLDEQLDIVADFLSKAIQHKKDSGIVGEDWLGLLAHALVNGTFLDTEELKTITYDLCNGNSAAFMFDIKYTLYLLGTHPEIQEKLFQELQTCMVNNEITVQSIHNCPYLLGVVNESLRLYPGGGALGGRMSIEQYNEDAVVLGYKIPPKVVIMANVQRIQTDERYWGKDAKNFTPERWNNGFTPVPGSYLPFGGGLKSCVGAPLGHFGIAVTTAHIVKNYQVTFTGQNPLEVRNLPVALISSPYTVDFTPRHQPHDEL
eukprot:CAMPEP_0168540840 /NCGR_PEP_ID=MMETSP0413-20121227/493_1 /TAXON_ID=136452 /ORGANISM="Filamoeba nolandi, Strain NC-AS-23-1" /LENGTH=1161 /DNA_ID=CAMNT_0008570605 /DNA_START=45 /DNA_END=3530 /DNA_ORIENTATION=-